MSEQMEPQKGIIRVLLNRENRLEALKYCKEMLKPLSDADQLNNTDYVNTLKVYLECDNNLTLASQKLYIHRNTMINRMSRIMELLDADFHDPAVRNEYYNIFQILEEV